MLSDGLLIYNGPAGQMIQGLGQSHNADVLVSPPFQTPFYFPTRLLVECKCYDEPLGLSFTRNVLGLREDINNFEIVTEDILKNRRNSRTTKMYSYPMERYLYQVALASSSGFRKTAISYACAHRIPLISFANSSMFHGFRSALAALDDIKDKSVIESLSNYFKNPIQRDGGYFPECAELFINEVEELTKNIRIGLLENGTVLFLYRDSQEGTGDLAKRPYGSTFSDGYSLHWSEEETAWWLQNGEDTYYFELPEGLMIEWKKNSDGWEKEFRVREEAIRLKEEYFTKIILFGNQERGEEIEVIRLSKYFLNEAYARLYEDR